MNLKRHVLTGLVAAALSLPFLPAQPASAVRAERGEIAQERCKVDAAYGVLLARRPDRNGWNYWQAVLDQRFANGNQIIEWYFPESPEYILVREDTSIFVHVRRMLSWSRGAVNQDTASWYLRSGMSRTQMLAYETTHHGRCAVAANFGFYVPTVRL